MLLDDKGACRHQWSPEVLAIATTVADGCSTCARRHYEEGESIVPAAIRIDGYWGCADRRVHSPNVDPISGVDKPLECGDVALSIPQVGGDE